MDIVVKLPDKDYSVMLTKIMLACHGCKIIELPKGHGDLIDRDEVEKRGRMIIIFKIIGVAAAISATTTYLGLKLVEWFECGK